MATLMQIAANRRNALKSTGPTSEEGKQRSRCNAVRHGLTAESVIGSLEDAAEYATFEAAIIADYVPRTVVERELVLRLASLLWRLRRATTMETGLFETETDPLAQFRKLCPSAPPVHLTVDESNSYESVGSEAKYERTSSVESGLDAASDYKFETRSGSRFARSFLLVANLPGFAFDRLKRYEMALWRQTAQVLFALDELNRSRRQRTRTPGEGSAAGRV